jgi:hypothetical protein
MPRRIAQHRSRARHPLAERWRWSSPAPNVPSSHRDFGHGDPALTPRVYSHVIPAVQETVAALVADLVA